MADRQPHVRVEMRKVYVFGKRAFRGTRGEAYKQAARRIMRAACECTVGDANDGFYETRCRFHHVECGCKNTCDGDVDECAQHKRLLLKRGTRRLAGCRFPYWMLVCLRLQRFMMFVDSRAEALRALDGGG